MVAAIPKTLGLGLSNSSFGSTFGTTWGGGMGGNVLGSISCYPSRLPPRPWKTCETILTEDFTTRAK